MNGRPHIRSGGLSLIEMLIVVVIVSILAAIAYPSYRQYVQRSKRSEAISALLQIATNQERHYLNFNTYTPNMTDLGFPVDSNYITDSETYEVNVTAADANSFAAEANYRPDDEEADKCATFSIDSTGVKGSAPSDQCWTNTR